MPDTGFKVLGTGKPLDFYRPVPQDTIPWAFAETFRERARRNHGQSLERLNERGGLSYAEIWLAMNDFNLYVIPFPSDTWAKPRVLAAVEAFKAATMRYPPISRDAA
jgi:hypothetical protein